MDNRHHPKRILVTGGAGFIGSNYVRHALAHEPDAEVVVLDALTYAGSLSNLAGLEANNDRYHFVHGDICDEALVTDLFAKYRFTTVVHLAAESHVDRSITGPDEFLRTNVHGTYVLLQAARKAWQNPEQCRFHHVSTDEVYGSLGPSGFFTEDTPYDPSSPYSASKAASDHLVRSWHRTFELPITISNCSNNYGPYQFPEKLIPLMIIKAITEQPMPVYGDGSNVRDWLHVHDHCEAIHTILTKAEPGTTFNIGGNNELSNLKLVTELGLALDEIQPRKTGCYNDLITFVKDRPGHDYRYAIDASRAEKSLGWTPAHNFENGLRETIHWYLSHNAWMEQIRSERYSGERLGV